MTCVCVKGEEIRKDTRCIHTGAETLEEAAIRGSPRGDEYWIGGQWWGTDILLSVYICI